MTKRDEDPTKCTFCRQHRARDELKYTFKVGYFCQECSDLCMVIMDKDIGMDNPELFAQPDKLVEEYTPLVVFIARQMAGEFSGPHKLDDLIKCGKEGLRLSATRYEPADESNFLMLALQHIRGSILEHIRSRG